MNSVDKYSLCILVAAPVAFAALELLAAADETTDIESARETAQKALELIHEILTEGNQ